MNALLAAGSCHKQVLPACVYSLREIYPVCGTWCSCMTQQVLFFLALVFTTQAIDSAVTGSGQIYWSPFGERLRLTFQN